MAAASAQQSMRQPRPPSRPSLRASPKSLRRTGFVSTQFLRERWTTTFTPGFLRARCWIQWWRQRPPERSAPMKRWPTRSCFYARMRRATFTARRSRSTAACSWCSKRQRVGPRRPCRIHHFDDNACHLRGVSHHRKERMQAEYASQIGGAEELSKCGSAVHRHRARGQQVTALIVEPERKLRGRPSVVKGADAKVEAAGSALGLSRIDAHHLGWDDQGGLSGDIGVIEPHLECDIAGRSSGLKPDAILRAEVAHGVALIHGECGGLIPGDKKLNSVIVERRHARMKFDLHVARAGCLRSLR